MSESLPALGSLGTCLYFSCYLCSHLFMALSPQEAQELLKDGVKGFTHLHPTPIPTLGTQAGWLSAL